MRETSATTSVDIAIIGAGPVGLFGAYYAGFRGRSVAVLDALPAVGGQVTAMYPEKLIHDVAGFPAVSGRELIGRLHEQAAPMSPEYHLGDRVTELELCSDQENPVLLRTGAGRTFAAGAVVIAGGVGAFQPRPMPAAPGLDPDDVAHFVSDLESYRGQDVVVVGGGDSAFDWALALHGVASRVSIVHRRSTFRAHAFTVDAVRDLGIEVLTDSVVSSATREHGRLVRLTVTRGDDVVHVPCQRVIAALGFTAQLGPILTWGLAVSGNRHLDVGANMLTSSPRVFAAGDITTYDGKVPLIAVGFGEIATAVNNACHVIAPEMPVFPGHSTDASARQEVA